MSIYGTFTESSSLNSIIGDSFYNENAQPLTEAEAIQFNKDLLEVMIDLNESEDYSIEEMFSLEEGANINMTEALRKHFGEIKSNIKSSKKKCKAKDYSGAKSDLSKAKSELKTMTNEIKKQESDAGSAILGVFAGGLLTVAQLICPLAIGMVGKSVIKKNTMKTAMGGLDMMGAVFAGASEEDINNMASNLVGSAAKTGIATAVTFVNNVILFVKEIIELVKSIKQLLKDINEKESAGNTLNLYRNRLLTICTDLEKKIDKAAKLIDKRASMK